YNSSEWHAANDLFVYLATTASGNKIVTHGYPFDEKHPRFRRRGSARITLGAFQCAPSLRGTGCVRCYLGRNDCIRLRYGEEPPPERAPTAARTTRLAFAARRVLESFANSVPADAALPGDQHEYFELQQALMLDIAEEAAPARTTERLLGLVLRQLRLLGTEADLTEARHAAYGGKRDGGRREGGGRRERSDAAASESGVSNEGPPPSASASVSGPSTPPAALPVCLSLGASDSASLRPPSDPAKLFSPAVPSRRSNTPNRARRLLPDSCVLYRPYSTPDLTLPSSGSQVLSWGNSSETSEESASVTFPLGEADAEGEGAVAGEVPGAEGEMNVD
ncbi:hypothetical protein B0H13DRAFT_1921800, partial [Mycena leptocephala]